MVMAYQITGCPVSGVDGEYTAENSSFIHSNGTVWFSGTRNTELTFGRGISNLFQALPATDGSKEDALAGKWKLKIPGDHEITLDPIEPKTEQPKPAEFFPRKIRIVDAPPLEAAIEGVYQQCLAEKGKVMYVRNDLELWKSVPNGVWTISADGVDMFVLKHDISDEDAEQLVLSAADAVQAHPASIHDRGAVECNKGVDVAVSAVRYEPGLRSGVYTPRSRWKPGASTLPNRRPPPRKRHAGRRVVIYGPAEQASKTFGQSPAHEISYSAVHTGRQRGQQPTPDSPNTGQGTPKRKIKKQEIPATAREV
jgi:hypothetical protein